MQRSGQRQVHRLCTGLWCPHGKPKSRKLLIGDAGGDQRFVELSKVETTCSIGIGKVARFIKSDFDAFWIPGSSFHCEDNGAGCAGDLRVSQGTIWPLRLALYRGTYSGVKRSDGCAGTEVSKGIRTCGQVSRVPVFAGFAAALVVA